MVYLLLVVLIVSIMDIRDLKSQNKKKDLYIYMTLMLLVTVFGIFYYSNTDRDSFSKIMLSLVGKEG